MPGMIPIIPVSWGELLDKMTILEIKRERIEAAAARANVAREYEALRHVGEPPLARADVAAEYRTLRGINEALWEIEDAIREEEAQGRFGETFVALARSVYRRNDERAAVKRRINVMLQSELVEEKCYRSFA